MRDGRIFENKLRRLRATFSGSYEESILKSQESASERLLALPVTEVL